MHATAREVTPEDAGWDAAVEVLRPERLNAVGDTAERWRQSCTIHLLTPHGRLVEGPGSYTDGSGVAPVPPGRHGDQRLAALALARPGRRPPQHPALTAAARCPARAPRPDSLCR